MSDTAKNNYEFAYHVSSNLEDADVQKARQELEKIITSHGGVISFAKDPEKVRLAYPINHQTQSFFGYFNFSVESPEESISKIRDEIKLNPNIFRFLLLKLEPEKKMAKEDLVRKIAAAEKRRMRAVKQAEKPSQKSDEPKVSEKELEDKLEAIIDKL